MIILIQCIAIVVICFAYGRRLRYIKALYKDYRDCHTATNTAVHNRVAKVVRARDSYRDELEEVTEQLQDAREGYKKDKETFQQKKLEDGIAYDELRAAIDLREADLQSSRGVCENLRKQIEDTDSKYSKLLEENDGLKLYKHANSTNQADLKEAMKAAVTMLNRRLTRVKDSTHQKVARGVLEEDHNPHDPIANAIKISYDTLGRIQS